MLHITHNIMSHIAFFLNRKPYYALGAFCVLCHITRLRQLDVESERAITYEFFFKL